MDMRKISVGVSDFKKMITGNYYYVDKTLFIKEILDRGDKVLLIPRPRRFGKTLNISMLKYFYDCCPETLPASPTSHESKPPATGNTYKSLFDSLAISKAGPQYLEKMGRHPVIFLTFENIKEPDWESCFYKIKQLIKAEYARHYYLMKSTKLKAFEVNYYQKMIDLKGDKGDYDNSLEHLLIFLNRYYGERAVILIDEYDTPVHAGYTNNYYDKINDFMQKFLCTGLKDTDPYLEKSVLTGVMAMAMDSSLSNFNNLSIFTILSKEFDDKFGFTEREVEKILNDFNIFPMYKQVQKWYNGYTFGNETIYNPWSIINFLASDGKELKPYWINTSDNQLVDSLLSKGGNELKKELEALIRGESIEKAIDENIVLKDIFNREDLLWSFLLMGGYLKQTQKRRHETSGKMFYWLAIPNMEVRITYSQIVDNYFSKKIENEKLEIMLKALIDGDIKLFEKMLQKVVSAVFSYHDFGGEPEKVYHALVTGLLVWISDTHEIKSNRESGYGRYDISIIPRDLRLTGYVIEFKTVAAEDNETVESAVNAALKQIEEKKYETELLERGITNIKKLAIVFSGKDVYVKEK